MEVKGLKCDNPDCGYQDTTVLREEYERYINYPCPKCGSPILTQADYDALLTIEKIENNPVVKIFNKLFPNKKMIVDMHGDGWRNLEIREPKEGELNE